MTDLPPGNGGKLPDEDESLGPPVRELADFTITPSPEFTGRSRRRIQRIVFTSQLLDLSWFSPFVVLREYLDVIVGWVKGSSGTSSGEKTHE